LLRGIRMKIRFTPKCWFWKNFWVDFFAASCLLVLTSHEKETYTMKIKRKTFFQVQIHTREKSEKTRMIWGVVDLGNFITGERPIWFPYQIIWLFECTEKKIDFYYEGDFWYRNTQQDQAIFLTNGYYCKGKLSMRCMNRSLERWTKRKSWRTRTQFCLQIKKTILKTDPAF